MFVGEVGADCVDDCTPEIDYFLLILFELR